MRKTVILDDFCDCPRSKSYFTIKDCQKIVAILLVVGFTNRGTIA